MEPAERLVGALERILYSDEETGYCVGEIAPSEGGPKVTVSGALPGVQCGETVAMEGSWYRHAKYGRQFKVARFQTRLPATVNGIRRYLGSGLVSGIGKGYADKIVDHFGDRTLEIISNESSRLQEVPGIGKARARSIKKAWDAQAASREVMIFLHTYGVTVGQSVRLVRRYGGEILQILKTNPYQLADEVDGIGFRTADRIALNLGIASNSKARNRAGVMHLISVAEGEGHTAVDEGGLITSAIELLEANETGLKETLGDLLESGDLERLPGGLLQARPLGRAEARLARSVKLVATGASGLPPIKIDAAVDWAEERAGFRFAPEQREGLRTALAGKLSILTGGPGTGKTTILRSLVRILKAKEVKILLASPTGRAAQRLAESAGMRAHTVHRLLEFDPERRSFARNEIRPLKADFVIVDESSMLDTRLAASLLAAVPAESHLLLVGDADQLPSVGAGNVLRDLIASGRLPTVRLQRIYRQGSGSGISEMAHQVLDGKMTLPESRPVPESPEQNDLRFVRAADPDGCIQAILAIVERLKAEGLSNALDFQILAPMHKGTCGVSRLNTLVQECFPGGPGSLMMGGVAYRTGDKVIQLRNDYDRGIFNGDVGRILEVGPETLTVDFGNGGVELDRNAVRDLSLAFAMTIHKSQGSEYPTVIVPLLMQHYVMLRRNLLYTAITRGKRQVWMVGDPKAFQMAVREVGGMDRRTDLVRKIDDLFRG